MKLGNLDDLKTFFAKPQNQRIILLLVAVLLILSTWLPPISFGKQILQLGIPVIKAAGGTVTGPLGLQIRIPPQSVSKRARVQIDVIDVGYAVPGGSVPSSAFRAAIGESALVRVREDSPETVALQSVPRELVPFGPMYRFAIKGDMPSEAEISVPVPYELKDIEMADLYGWDGNAWHWLGSRVNSDGMTLEAHIKGTLPQLLMVASRRPIDPSLGIELTSGESAPEILEMMIDASAASELSTFNKHVDLSGLHLDTNGIDIAGEPVVAEEIPASKTTGVFLVVTNEIGGIVRSDLVDNLIIDPERVAQHIEHLTTYLTKGPYDGLIIAYANVDPTLRAEFTAFVEQLASAVHERQALLGIRVDMPQGKADGWDTGAYDWQAIGVAADFVRIPALLEPQAYQPEGEMDQLLIWATDQIERSKIRLIIPTLSHDRVRDEIASISYQEALARLGEGLSVDNPSALLLPGESIRFGIPESQRVTLQFDAPSALYWYQYEDPQGSTRRFSNWPKLIAKSQSLSSRNLRWSGRSSRVRARS